MKKIIIVDGVKMVRDLLIGVSRSLGLSENETQIFNDPRFAWKDIQKNPRDLDALLITDVDAPQFHGLNLLSNVKEHYPNIRVIVTSVDTRHSGGAQKLGADGFIFKDMNKDQPFCPSCVEHMIRDFF